MNDPERDIKLMLRVSQNDDADALQELYRIYRGPLCKFLYYCVFDYAKVEDYLQEVFLRLWRSRKNYRASGKFSTYIFQIAKNYFLNEREKRMRRPGEYSLDAPFVGKDGNAFVSQTQSSGFSPDEEAFHGELAKVLEDAIGTLPEMFQMVFRLSQIEGFKYREISEILEIPEGTVKSRMSKAVRLLRSRLAKVNEEGIS